MKAIQRLIKDQDRVDMRNRRGKRGRDDSWVPYVDNEADHGTINGDMEYRRWSRFGGDCSKYCGWAHRSPNPTSNGEDRKAKCFLISFVVGVTIRHNIAQWDLCGDLLGGFWKI